MNLVGDSQRRHKKGRSKAEKTFKRLNFPILAVQAACFLIPVAYCYIAAGSTFEGSFISPGDYKLVGGFRSKTADCEFPTTFSMGGYSEVEMNITADNQYKLITETASDIQRVFYTYAVALGLGAVTKLMFDMNYFFTRVRHFVIHKEIITTLEIAFLIFVYSFASAVEERSATIVDYFEYCGIDSDSLFHLPAWIALYIGNSVVLFFHLVSIAIYIHNAACVPDDKVTGIPAHDTPAGMRRAMDHHFQMADKYGSYTIDGDNPDAIAAAVASGGIGQAGNLGAGGGGGNTAAAAGGEMMVDPNLGPGAGIYTDHEGGAGLEEPPSLAQAAGLEAYPQQ